MWPCQQLQQDAPESRNNALEGTDSNSETNQLMHGPSNSTTVDLILLKSFQTYAAVQRTTAVHQIRCECSEVFALHRRDTRQWHNARTFMSDHDLSRIEFPHDSRSQQALSNDEGFEIITVPNSFVHGPVSSCCYRDVLEPVQDSPPPSIDPCPDPLPRRRQRYVQTMPQPNLLAKQVANRLIKYARYAKNLHEEDMCCLNCGLFPICPVTGKCGHTCCIECIERTRICPCGKDSKGPLYVNILIRDLVARTLAECHISSSRIKKTLNYASKAAARGNKLSVGGCSLIGSSVGPIKIKRRNRLYFAHSFPAQYRQNIPMSARARYFYALDLLSAGRHKDAAPHLAIAAASLQTEHRLARPLLAQVIMVLSRDRNPRALSKELNLLVRHMSTMKSIKRKDLECILCSDIFIKPVTTPCGHMFCRTCLEKTQDYTNRCPLCMKELTELNLKEINDTVFIRGALASINALVVPQSVEDDNVVPIFVCTVAYPSVPCPLFIFDPRYWLMVRRVLESGSRRFGMVSMDKDKKYADYGTILEVRDCVHLEDGKSILSTIGLSRFKVIERCVHDGCEVARIEPIRDIRPRGGVAKRELQMYGSHVLVKTVWWLSQLSSDVMRDIVNAFGSIPTTGQSGENGPWWDSNDGPAWLWWLVAVLPLRTEIKILILSTDRLLKRMKAVARTLDAVEHIRLTTLQPDNCKVQVSMSD